MIQWFIFNFMVLAVTIAYILNFDFAKPIAYVLLAVTILLIIKDVLRLKH